MSLASLRIISSQCVSVCVCAGVYPMWVHEWDINPLPHPFPQMMTLLSPLYNLTLLSIKAIAGGSPLLITPHMQHTHTKRVHSYSH